MNGRIHFLVNRLRERLWIRPLMFCIFSVAGAFLARIADQMDIAEYVPEITPNSIETLLSIVAASMLVIATFAVASMVSAYASATSSATPRSFPLIISDDVSKNALSVFVGAFIFSIVALVALQNGYYERAGHFALFVLTLSVFAWVVLTFVNWVDKIARLGRLGTTIDKVEAAAASALQNRRRSPNLGGVAPDPSKAPGDPVFCSTIGYVQRVDVAALQRYAEKHSLRITVVALPGAFAVPDIPLCYFAVTGGEAAEDIQSRLAAAFIIGDGRVFEDDPRFGLIALSEIAARALSPAVNDPGTAIDVIGTLLRLFSAYIEPLERSDGDDGQCALVQIPELSIHDMFDDAFTCIARDGAGAIEVQIRLQKAFASLAAMGDAQLRDAARRHSRQAFARARRVLSLPEDIEVLTGAAKWSGGI